MTRDSVDFVRQGAFIALGMILVEQSDASSPSLASTRSLYTKVVSDKHEDPVARFGAAIGQGLIDAGGRNVTISLLSRAGSRNTNAIVGMVMFCQFWYWYPLAHCACLAFEPTGIIGLNADLKVSCCLFVSLDSTNVLPRCQNSSLCRMPGQACSLIPRQRNRRRKRQPLKLRRPSCPRPPK